jgi:hypothetical protein
MNSGGTGEWCLAYPLLQLLAETCSTAAPIRQRSGVLNGSEAVAWGEWFQHIRRLCPCDPCR